MKTPNNTYRRFIEFEERAADVYLQLASRFSSEHPELSALWLQMAMEEKQHATLLHFCLAQRWFAPNLPDDSEIRKFSALFRRLDKRAADRKIDVDAAFLLAWEMESSEVNTIYCYLTTPLHKSLYLLRKKIIASPPDHIDRLVVAGKKFGASAETIKKLASLKKSSPEKCF